MQIKNSVFKIHQMEVNLVFSKEYLYFTEKITDVACHWSEVLLDLKTVTSCEIRENVALQMM